MVAAVRTPACMSQAEADLWAEMDRRDRLIGHRNRSEGNPCDDCVPAFAAEQRARGCCDGHYPGEADYIGPRCWYPTEEQRQAARRRTLRESSQRARDRQRRALQAAT